jgi:hypothetical protein
MGRLNTTDTGMATPTTEPFSGLYSPTKVPCALVVVSTVRFETALPSVPTARTVTVYVLSGASRRWRSRKPRPSPSCR